jgi:hypothetical protein
MNFLQKFFFKMNFSRRLSEGMGGARRSVYMCSLSSLLVAALCLVSAGADLPAAVEGLASGDALSGLSSAAARQKLDSMTQNSGGLDDYADYYVVDGQGYAKFRNYNAKNQQAYVDALNLFAEKLPENMKMYSLLVPTSAEFDLSEKYSYLFPSQRQVIDEVYDALDDRFTTIDIYNILQSHKDEYLYFRTDHHWTARAGYLAYTKVAPALGLQAQPESAYTWTDSGTSFLGSIYSATGCSGLSQGMDRLYYYKLPYDVSYTYWDNSGVPHSSKGVYKDWYLTQTNKYAFFMGGDLPYIKLVTGAGTGRKLAVIKDSYANTILPFLTAHYDEIYVIDPRNSNFNALQIVEENQPDDVLFINYARVVCLPKFSAGLGDLLTRDYMQFKAEAK